MALPKHPSPMSEEERQVLAEKFAEHEPSEEQQDRQDKYRQKLAESEE